MDVEPELGNLLFGCSRGAWPVPRTAEYETPIQWLLQSLSADSVDTPVFAVRPYYWGDCTCTYADAEAAWCAAHQHTATCYYTAYHAVPRKMMSADVRALCKAYGIPWNGGRGSACHCTCAFEQDWNAWSATHEHAVDCRLVLPNFHYKPTNFQLQWYKYPLRDAYANRKIVPMELRRMVQTCLRSLEEVA